MVEYLINHGADINQTTANGLTPLHLASQSGNQSIVEYLVTHHADVNAKNKDGWMPLHLASQAGYQSIVEYLVTNGANANATTNEGYTPAYLASMKRYRSVVEYLVTHGASIHEPSSSLGQDKDKDKDTSLSSSSSSSSSSLIPLPYTSPDQIPDHPRLSSASESGIRQCDLCTHVFLVSEVGFQCTECNATLCKVCFENGGIPDSHSLRHPMYMFIKTEKVVNVVLQPKPPTALVLLHNLPPDLHVTNMKTFIADKCGKIVTFNVTPVEQDRPRVVLIGMDSYPAAQRIVSFYDNNPSRGFIIHARLVSSPATFYTQHSKTFERSAYQCDGCGKPMSIWEKAYHCTECHNFDYCGVCYKENPEHTSQHMFVELSTTHPYPLQRSPSSRQTREAEQQQQQQQQQQRPPRSNKDNDDCTIC